MTLTEFLLARIADDEAAAHKEDADYANTTLLPTYDSEHQARWNTERVLAECKAKRRIIEHHNPCDDWWFGDPSTCPELQALALPYADHPDYDEAWRP